MTSIGPSCPNHPSFVYVRFIGMEHFYKLRIKNEKRLTLENKSPKSKRNEKRVYEGKLEGNSCMRNECDKINVECQCRKMMDRVNESRLTEAKNIKIAHGIIAFQMNLLKSYHVGRQIPFYNNERPFVFKTSPTINTVLSAAFHFLFLIIFYVFLNYYRYLYKCVYACVF